MELKIKAIHFLALLKMKNFLDEESLILKSEVSCSSLFRPKDTVRINTLNFGNLHVNRYRR